MKKNIYIYINIMNESYIAFEVPGSVWANNTTIFNSKHQTNAIKNIV